MNHTEIGEPRMKFVYDDGGRAGAGFKGPARDCVTRSIAIATRKPYQEVYDALNRLALSERTGKRKKKISDSRTGVFRQSYQCYLESLGWQWTATMSIGSGCRVHMRPEELPSGRLVVALSKHLTAVIDGVIHDTHNCSRKGKRCVYGYFFNPAESPTPVEETMKPIETISNTHVDSLLGLADQFLEDWAEDAVQAGKPDPDYEERMAEWTATRPVLLAAPAFLRALVEITYFCHGSSDPMAKRCGTLARAGLEALPEAIRPSIG